MQQPERATEFDDLWIRYQPHFQKIEDKPGFNLEASSLFVLSTDRTTLTIWLLGYAMWKEMYCWSSNVFFHPMTSSPFVPAHFEHMPGQQEAYAEADTLHAAAMVFMENQTLDMHLWPHGIPKPREILAASKEEQLVNDLVHHTVAFFYLHELRHLILANSGENALTPLDEEFECDRWASEFLVGKSEFFDGQSGVDLGLVKTKRAMGLALGAAVMAHVQQCGLWEATKSHPAVADRFLRLSKGLQLGIEDHFWIVACTFALASLRRKKAMPEQVIYEDLRDLFNKLLAAAPAGTEG